MQCFTVEDLAKKDFAKKHNINIEDIEKINIKDKLQLHLKSGISIQIPLSEIEQIARPACIACGDFANDFADISVGGLGSDDGYTTVMVRNSIGKQVYSEALYKGYIHNKSKCSHYHDKEEKNELVSLIKDFASRKRIRAENRMNSSLKKFK
ncbi:MAG: Coenzyme F420 hydrogenase/dehydrogenase, beta subunit C-terminal domain [Candidatus Cloacimonetes bacterium]|nr:Coenzyme F420 hydrogenase/dehydrogenase, beta subunit C-terminal domain [Candidatus Cloacimonadota bacterium]